MTFCYKFFDWLPEVPYELVKESYASFENQIIKNNQNKHWDTKSQEIFNDGHKDLQNVAFVQYDLPEYIINWFKDNIVESGYTDIRISRSTMGDGKLAHTDNTRDYVLIYMLESGGERPETIFYRQKKHPLLRERGVRVYDYNTVDIIDKIYIPPEQWIMLNTRILHGVIGLSNHRISYQIGLNYPYRLHMKGLTNE